MDPRVTRLADVLVNYSLELKKGQLFVIKGEHVSLELIQAVYEAALSAGAFPSVQFETSGITRHFLDQASSRQLDFVSPITAYEFKKVQAMLTIWGGQNTRNLSSIDSGRIQRRSRAMAPLLRTMQRRMADKSLKWCGTIFPTQAEAQEAVMSLDEWGEFIYHSGHVDVKNSVAHWEQVSKEQARLVKILNRFKKIHLEADGTDLTMLVGGRRWVNCDGKVNFPDGEVFTGPIENSVNGRITFSYPLIYQGHEIEGICLEFENGRVVRESAQRDKEFLTTLLNIDKGARYVGEIAAGTNYNNRRFTKHMLLDEKIGGTWHLAVGRSIPESLGCNQSALHLDMICDMRHGRVTADRTEIYSNGRFRI